jgi:predicted TIM-barrel fold metal-dependent hydrolase
MSVFDAHLHIVDPRFPLVPNQGYVPEPFTVADYRRTTAHLGITGGAVVSGSFQAFDQTYLRAALHELGPGFAGVTHLPADVRDAEIEALHAAGVRAVRFNLRRGGSAGLEDLEPLARRAHALAGWHAELYVEARDLPDLFDRLKPLPAICIDHLGLTTEGFPALLRLVADGARVKASGFGRVEGDVSARMRAIHQTHPGALVFGTDLPSTRAPRPFADTDIELIRAALGPQGARRALHDNGMALYGVGLVG